ncbi:SDR family NAD(P)-dependent oxidoreductase, partial [bacterium LRH843]|nr:SDR family NAD(P)-dependent oxidoreductase [bacterium LRH843]
MRLAGKTAIVTGGASGFGAGIVRKFRAEGAEVMIADLNGAAAHDMAQATGSLAHETDVAKGESVAALAQSALSAWGRIDIVVNNAGIT